MQFIQFFISIFQGSRAIRTRTVDFLGKMDQTIYQEKKQRSAAYCSRKFLFIILFINIRRLFALVSTPPYLRPLENHVPHQKGVAKQLFPYIVPQVKFESSQSVASILVDIRSNLVVSNMPKTTNSFGGAFSPFLRSGQEHQQTRGGSRRSVRRSIDQYESREWMVDRPLLVLEALCTKGVTTAPLSPTWTP